MDTRASLKRVDVVGLRTAWASDGDTVLSFRHRVLGTLGSGTSDTLVAQQNETVLATGVDVAVDTVVAAPGGSGRTAENLLADTRVALLLEAGRTFRDVNVGDALIIDDDRVTRTVGAFNDALVASRRELAIGTVGFSLVDTLVLE